MDLILVVIELESRPLDYSSEITLDTASFKFRRLEWGRTTLHILSPFLIYFDVATCVVTILVIFDFILLPSIHRYVELDGFVHELLDRSLKCFAQLSVHFDLNLSIAIAVFAVQKFNHFFVLLDILNRKYLS